MPEKHSSNVYDRTKDSPRLASLLRIRLRKIGTTVARIVEEMSDEELIAEYRNHKEHHNLPTNPTKRVRP